MISLYSLNNINNFPISEYAHQSAKTAYLLPLIRHGTKTYIEKADVEVGMITLDNMILPIVISNPIKKHESNYIVSPYAQYVSYAQEAINKDTRFDTKMKRQLGWGYGLLGNWLKWTKFDDVVFVNNWLLSTNLWDHTQPDLLPDMIKLLRDHYPKRAIVFRSVTNTIDEKLFNYLKSLGLIPIVSRHIYVMNPEKGLYKKKRPFQQDTKFAEKMGEQGLYWTSGKDAHPDEYAIIASYYRSLYIDKYSHYNPAYTDSFVRLMIDSNLLNVHLIRHEGKIVAVLATFEQNGVITTPFIGYDPNAPAEWGLYRLMNMKLMQEAIDKNLILHQSSGAGDFKKQRGGESAYEYHFIDASHLNLFRRSPWKLFQYITDRFIIPNMEKYGV
jgi:hypothetical protein